MKQKIIICSSFAVLLFSFNAGDLNFQKFLGTYTCIVVQKNTMEHLLSMVLFAVVVEVFFVLFHSGVQVLLLVAYITHCTVFMTPVPGTQQPQDVFNAD